MTGEICASAPGKVILFGEHAVVYNKLGIACAIDKRVRCNLLPTKDEFIALKAGDLNEKITLQNLRSFYEKTLPLVEREDFHKMADLAKNDFFASIKYLLADIIMPANFRGFSIEINSDIPPKMGMGSSSAVSCVVAFAVSKFIGSDYSHEILTRLTIKADVIAHGIIPSGIDTTVAINGGIISFKKNGQYKPVKVNAKISLIIGCTGEEKHTGSMVSMVRDFLTHNSEKFYILDKIEKISLEALQLLSEPKLDLQRLGEKFSENHKCLQELGVSSSKLDLLVEASLKGGAYGAKLSGAGGGGIIIALSPPGIENKIIREIERYGGKAFITQIEGRGLREESII